MTTIPADPRELGVEDHEIDEAVSSVLDHPVYAHLTADGHRGGAHAAVIGVDGRDPVAVVG